MTKPDHRVSINTETLMMEIIDLIDAALLQVASEQRNCCIETAKLVSAVLTEFGVDSYPMACTALVDNPKFVEVFGDDLFPDYQNLSPDVEAMLSKLEQGTSKASLGDLPFRCVIGLPEGATNGIDASAVDKTITPDGWDGHLVNIVFSTKGDAYLLDSSISQAERPERRVVNLGGHFIPYNSPEDLQTCLVSAVNDSGVRLTYLPRVDDESYMELPAWKNPEIDRLCSVVTNRIICRFVS